MCMYHEIGDSPLALRNWKCGSVYMHVAHEQVRPYVAADCQAVLDGINDMNRHSERAAAVMMDGAHEPGHPLPGVWTVRSPSYRVDFRVYRENPEDLQSAQSLWAEVYRTRD